MNLNRFLISLEKPKVLLLVSKIISAKGAKKKVLYIFEKRCPKSIWVQELKNIPVGFKTPGEVNGSHRGVSRCQKPL
ncbi:hypothetical protein C9439_07075 [archaeon SCG-AAA382B04]|nr:hypothetical protein C9439_07075 [archaeon SCG-AAA382B04]